MTISIQNLSFAYGKHEVLKNISVEIPDNTLINVLGHNGAGKSTLFRCILSLENSYKGQVLVDGKDLRKMTVRDRAKLISFIPQSHAVVYDYEALEVVLMSTASGVAMLSTPTKEQEERAWDALERVGIAHLAHRPTTQLSGGEQQLVLIARALAQGAKTIVMDEPTSALDYGNTVRVLACVRELAREGYSIIQSTHQPDHAFLFADDVLVIDGGGVRAFGNPKDVITEELVADIYGIDVKISSLFNDRVRVCTPVDELDLEGDESANDGLEEKEKEGR